MDYDSRKKIVNGIIENEFKNISEYKEKEFQDSSKEQTELVNESEALFEKLNKNMSKEYRQLLDDYYVAVTAEQTNLCKFYFKAGLRAGLFELEFMKDIAEYML